MEAKNKASCDTVQRRLFGTAPSESEAEHALTELHNFTTGIHSPGTVLDRLQHTVLSYHPKIRQSDGYKRVIKALSFLHTDSSFQRVVVSLSCDKALWTAVMNNKEVVELKERLLPVHVANMSMPKSCVEEPDLALGILKWILELTKTMITELIENFKSLVNAVFQAHHPGDFTKSNEQLEEKLAFVLSTSSLSSLQEPRCLAPKLFPALRQSIINRVQIIVVLILPGAILHSSKRNLLFQWQDKS